MTWTSSSALRVRPGSTARSQLTVPPADIVDGAQVNEDNVAGGVISNVRFLLVPRYAAVSVAAPAVADGFTPTLKVTELEFSAIGTESGWDSMPSVLRSKIALSLAGFVTVAVQVVVTPAASVIAPQVSEESVGGSAARRPGASSAIVVPMAIPL